jgi:long-chain acyl-CoA synthetase
MADVFTDLLASRALAEPDAVAITDEVGTVSLWQLDQGVDAVAAEVLRSGARRVAVIASNSAEFLVHVFGIWRAGSTAVTIYPSSPASEVEYALRHSSVDLVFADDEAAGKVPDGYPLALLSREAPATPSAPHPVVDPEDDALICYTSGSTERPKAVLHSHASLLRGALAYADVWHLGPRDTTLVMLPMAWAFGLVTTSMAGLASGGRIRSVRRAQPEAVIAAINDSGVTFVAGVTTVFAKLVAALQSGARLEAGSLRLCISGGEPRHEGVFAEWRRLTGVPVHDVYAASECFPVVTYDPIADPEPIEGFAGRVVAGSELRLWDADAGAFFDGPGIGEAFVRGGAFFTGYQGDPDLTAKVLTPDGWYRTGDQVELRPDGLVRVLGRLSGMIIRGGANVAPAEVERVVRTVDGVDDVVVLGVPDEMYGQRIVALVRSARSIETLTGIILEHCRTGLAAYKVPSEIVIVEDFPLNDRTGKIDRRVLEAQYLEMSR